ncbi:MAG TPA: GNAT family N-acetyltransferase [Gallionellaceae bacterium]|nr:GNAT family N-acetyltransferase [Gallionellaceae bacterium]
MSYPFTVSLVSWHDGEPLLRAIREAVFLREQQVPVTLEWDGLDEDCRHALALSMKGDAIGCGRIIPPKSKQSPAHIGRLAVLPDWRGKRVGTALLEALLDYARAMKYPEVIVHAQVQAKSFYDRFGFEAEGDEFMDAGIPHVLMRLSLATDDR